MRCAAGSGSQRSWTLSVPQAHGQNELRNPDYAHVAPIEIGPPQSFYCAPGLRIVGHLNECNWPARSVRMVVKHFDVRHGAEALEDQSEIVRQIVDCPRGGTAERQIHNFEIHYHRGASATKGDVATGGLPAFIGLTGALSIGAPSHLSTNLNVDSFVINRTCTLTVPT